MPGILEALLLAFGFGLGYWIGQRNGSSPGLDRENKELRAQTLRLEKDLTRFETEKASLEERIRTHQDELLKLQQQAQTQFENLAGRILERNTEKFRESSEKNLLTLLNPLRERIQDFEKKVEDTYRTETRERFALKEELKRIVELNQQMTIEATNLTRALKADVKVQGNWGELILERLLSRSGLREGEEYVTQGEGMKLKTEGGDHQRPDVIVNLPDNKHLIIDSKVSLKSYELHCSVDPADDKARALKQFLESVYKHVDGLSAKHYSSLEGLRSPDFVLLFMPLEPAFSLALQSDPDLVPYAWDKRVAFVSPTTLLVTLGTVASIWKTERQNKNALEIARQGGALYDKFVAFVGDLERIGKNIEDTRRSYDEAFNKLRDGKGNLINRVESLRKLGAKVSKGIDEKHLPENEFLDTESLSVNKPS